MNRFFLFVKKLPRYVLTLFELVSAHQDYVNGVWYDEDGNRYTTTTTGDM